MNKPPAGPLSDLVRRCPEVSPRQDEIRGEQNPPNPPQSGGDGVRVDRVRRGSRRRRDLEATRRPDPVPDGILPSEQATEAWDRAVASLTRFVPAYVLHQTIEPARVLGEVDGKLCVVAPPHAARWLRARYSAFLATAITPLELAIYDEVTA